MRIFGDPSNGTLDEDDFVFVGILPVPFDLALTALVATGVLILLLAHRQDLSMELTMGSGLSMSLGHRPDLNMALTMGGS